MPLFATRVGQRSAERRDGNGLVAVQVVFPLAQRAFVEAEATGRFVAVVAQFAESQSEVDGALAHASFERAAGVLAGPVCGFVHDCPHHVHVILERVGTG